MDDPLVTKAREFARRAHAGQTRKYTGEPYAEHPERVAATLAQLGFGPEVQAAALLHDVVEDTGATDLELRGLFGDRVADLVAMVTDASRPSDGNRAARKALDRAHIAEADADGQSIKAADMIDNMRSIFRHDPAFGRVYAAEKDALLAVMARAHGPGRRGRGRARLVAAWAARARHRALRRAARRNGAD